jgi:enoyl-CoA hydratase
MSAYQQLDLSLEEAISNEFQQGVAALREEASTGAKKFAGGAGRHGSFERSS